MRVCRLLHVLISSTANGSVMKPPVNMAAVVGTMANFTCVSNETSRIGWDFYYFVTKTFYTVWINYELEPIFLLNTTQCHSEKRCDVAINVTSNSSGAFECHELARSAYYLATLTVLGEIIQFVQPVYRA
jgi:hypothetical protein